MSEKVLLEKLNALVKKHGQTSTGNMLGYDGSFIKRVLLGERPMPDGLVTALGYEKVVKYRKTK